MTLLTIQFLNNMKLKDIMSDQAELIFYEENESKKSTFRTIHYLGSKLRILDFIKSVMDEIDPEKNGICDLFSGSGSVSQHLSTERKVTSVDIQKYSNVICSALISPENDNYIASFKNIIEKKLKETNKIHKIISLIKYEEEICSNLTKNQPDILCDFIENASIYGAFQEIPNSNYPKFKNALIESISNIKKSEEDDFLATKYFGGIYFSYKQAVTLDIILDCIKSSDDKYHNTLMAALLSTASDIVNTVGKQFAQPIRPRDKNNIPKKGLLKQLKKDRDLDVISIYTTWLKKYSSRPKAKLPHKALHMDYKIALEQLDDDTKIIYADPPYTRDHYSRFYHGLETLCLMDHPTISTTKIGGTLRLSRGLYREERHQSDFCVKSKAPDAFKFLFKNVSSKNKTLILSYSPYDKSNGAHPRVVELDFLMELASEYFEKVEIRSPGKFSHNKLNRSDLHLSSSEDSEILLICRNLNET